MVADRAWLGSVQGTAPAWEPALTSNDSGLAHVPLSVHKRWLSALKGLWAWVPRDTWGGYLLLPPPESLAAGPSSGGPSS